MIEERLVSLLREAAAAASPALGDAPPPETIELTRPPNREFGDFSTNLALVWASQLGARPKEVAQAIVDNLPDDPLVERAEVVPEDGYHGDYVVDIARRIRDEHGDGPGDLPPDERFVFMRSEGAHVAMESIRATLARFGVE